MDCVIGVDLDGRVSAQRVGGDELLDLGIDSEDGEVNGDGGAEGKIGHHGVVGLGEGGDLEAVLHGHVHLSWIGLNVGSLGQDDADGVTELLFRNAF